MKEPRGLPQQKTYPSKAVTPFVHNRAVVVEQTAPQGTHGKQFLPPRQRHTAEELDAMRSKGICFKCKGKYFRGHICPLKELQILTVVNGLDLEVLEEEYAEGIEVVEEVAPVLCCLSMNSYLGKHSPRTTKLQGIVGRSRVVMLIDSGGSHNFVTPSLASHLKLKSSADTNMEVMLGNGISVQGSGVCRGVQFKLADVEFKGDFINLDLGGVDVILGVEWLETLGPCLVDWKSQVWQFTYNGKRVTLQGDPALHYPAWSPTENDCFGKY